MSGAKRHDFQNALIVGDPQMPPLVEVPDQALVSPPRFIRENEPALETINERCNGPGCDVMASPLHHLAQVPRLRRLVNLGRRRHVLDGDAQRLEQGHVLRDAPGR